MSKDNLTHSEKYVRKTNRIILAIGITSFLIFIFGVYLLIKSNQVEEEFEEPVFTDNDDVFADVAAPTLSQNIEFSTMEGEIPLTTTPDPVLMGEVVLGTDAKNVLTLGTNGKAAVRIVSVELADPPADGFNFQSGCDGMDLSGEDTCHITMSWAPVVAGNVQNNFIITWHESNVSQNSAKAEKVPVYGDGMNVRDWLYVYDHCSAIDTVLHKGRVGEVYNIGGHNEKTNLEITHLILDAMNRDESCIEFVEDRLGHDRRYAISNEKIKSELGWEPSVTFEEGILLTIDWYLNNQAWMKSVEMKKGSIY